VEFGDVRLERLMKIVLLKIKYYALLTRLYFVHRCLPDPNLPLINTERTGVIREGLILPEGFSLRPITEVDIMNESLKLKSNLSNSIKNIPSKVLIQHRMLWAPIVTIIFNMSIWAGIFPDTLKFATLTPLYKGKGSRLEPTNYRPIANIKFFAKLFERLIKNQLNTYLSSTLFYSPSQFGFRANHSTEQATAIFTSYIYDAIDRGKVAVGISIDIRKAFDCINHKILIEKLKTLKFDNKALSWFRSYLENRDYATLVGGSISPKITTNIGCPQGSILAPILFLIYINSLFAQCPDLLKMAFADDTNLLAIFCYN
jgi:hypothetical protein